MKKSKTWSDRARIFRGFTFVLVLVLATALLSGCVQSPNNSQSSQSKTTVKVGDNISVDYVGKTEDGKVFDTSIESVAKQNNITQPRKYQPLQFTVGSGKMIKGFDEGVVGMKVGESKTITIPPDKGYGPIDPKLIQVFPIIESIPAKATVPRTLEIPATEFESTFGKNHSVGDSVNMPETNVNLTIKSIGTNVSLEYNFPVGYKIVQRGAPWNETVLSINDNNFTVTPDVKVNDVVTIRNVPWNTTVVAINDTNITIRHNAIPDREIPMLGRSVRIHFNDTSIIVDENNKLAGKTLIFEVTVKSIA